MGGNLLHHWDLPAKRLSKEEYFHLIEDISIKLNTLNLEFRVLENYRNKDSFGDMDIIIEKAPLDWHKTIERLFDVTPNSNTDIHSFPVNGFQVDLIVIPKINLQTAFEYFYGELGNIMGRIYHKLGLKYSHEGLKYIIRQELFSDAFQKDSSHIMEEIILSKNLEEICEVGGFDYSVRKKGMDSLEDMFQFVANSKFFNPVIFKIEELNHINRTRNRKRKNYTAFIQWNEANKSADGNYYQFQPKSFYLEMWKERFPFLRERIAANKLKFEQTNIIKEKINGKILMEWFPNIEGKAIGELMKQIKSHFSFDELVVVGQDAIKDYAFSLDK